MDRNRGWEGDSVLLQKVRLVRACGSKPVMIGASGSSTSVRLVRACGSKLNITMHKSAGLLVRLVRACGSKHPDDCCAGIIMFGQARKSLWIETQASIYWVRISLVRLVRACGSKPLLEGLQGKWFHGQARKSLWIETGPFL